jgi:hypothetical protein
METGRGTIKVGDNIDSWCGKCKFVLAHTIEAMVGDKPARVSCNTCRSQHSYKAHAPRTDASSTKREGAGSGTRTGKSGGNRYQSLLKAKDSVPPKIYSPKDKYEAGDILEHSKFGRGITMAVKDGTKIEVLFESGQKTLIHAG